MAGPVFTREEIEAFVYRPVLDAGDELLRSGDTLASLRVEGTDIVATFCGEPGCTAVVSRKSTDAPIQAACTCGFAYGSACEHVAALLLSLRSGTAADGWADRLSPATGNGGKQSSHGEPAQLERVQGVPSPRLYLRENDGLLIVELRFAYLDGAVEFTGRDRSSEKLVAVSAGRIVWLQRSIVKELDHTGRLQEAGLRAYSGGTYTPAGEQSAWVREHLPELSSQGFEVFGEGSLVSCRTLSRRPSLSLAVAAEKGGLVEFVVDVEYDGSSAPLSRIYEAVIAGRNYVKLSDGSAGQLPESWIEKLEIVFALCEKRPQENRLTMHRAGVAALEGLASIADEVAWKGVRAGFPKLVGGPERASCMPVPSAFKGVLRGYQQEGYAWFHLLQEHGLGGCLADDMGLGKTVQALALLVSEKEGRAAPRTSLLIVPRSLLSNWQREARKFGPTLLVMTYHGRERRRFDASDMAMADVVLTTYGTLQREVEQFTAMPFNYVILDEAQAVKNWHSVTAGAVRALRAKNRLALSGTPIENNLSELWSLFAFLNPGLLGPFGRFAQAFIRPIEKEPSGRRVEVLRSLSDPCILRRTKEQVAKELPPKTDVVMKVPMVPRQRLLYDMTRDACREFVARTIDAKGIDRSRMHVLKALTRLRQLCCHPRLVDPSYGDGAGKFEALDDLLPNIAGGNHKALIFSPFVSALDLLRPLIAGRNIGHEYLTGKIVDRQRVVDRFQEDGSVSLMLVSLKAGGVGLNLTAADYVVLLDPWWNPAAENQAADRAHRIGQTRRVFVYKLIAEDSVEERVLELQHSKKELFNAVLSTRQTAFRDLKRDEIERLFE